MDNEINAPIKYHKLEKFLDVHSRDTATIWAAVAYGHRMNNTRYIKFDREAYHDQWTEQDMPEEIANRTYAFEALLDPDLLTKEDYELGSDVRHHFRGLTMKMLSGEINNFEKVALETIDIADFENDPQANYHFSVALSLPSVYDRATERESIDDEIAELKSEYYGSSGDRYLGEIRVLRTIYSKNYDTYFVTAVIKESTNHVVFFANKNSYKYGEILKIRGNVKAHRDAGQTQLNRVRILDE